MNRDRIRSLLLLGVVVLAFGATAATIDSGDLSDGDAEPSPPEGEVNLDLLPTPSEGSGSLCPESLNDPLVFALFAGFVVVVAGVVSHSRPAYAPLSVVVGVPLLFGGSACSSLVSIDPLVELSAGVILPPMVLIAGIVLALCGVFAFLFVRSDDPTALGGDEQSQDDPVDLEELGRAAGDAADRIEAQEDITNEVYRAWYEMVRHLNVSNPQSATPDEFEQRAIEAGMRATDVSELTRLFEDVRYGEYDPEGREERAVAALRRIERAYAQDGGGEETE